jgi:phosphatidylserine/phosphatidylglycerophosphate/cardiolipin synthase-like enzyme
MYLVDDVAYLGGVNFTFEKPKNDLMVKIKDAKLVEWLKRWVEGFSRGRQNLPVEYRVDHRTTVLMDNRLKAPIYDEFVRWAKSCRRAWVSSRMCPSGPAMDFLAGKDTRYFFNPLKNMAPPTRLAIVLDTRKWQIKNSYTGSKYIHAKCALFDDLTAIVSSNNFNHRGPNWRTTEVGIVTTEPSLVRDVRRFFDSLK